MRGGVGAIRRRLTAGQKAAVKSWAPATAALPRTRSSSAAAASTCFRIASTSCFVRPSNRVKACQPAQHSGPSGPGSAAPNAQPAQARLHDQREATWCRCRRNRRRASSAAAHSLNWDWGTALAGLPCAASAGFAHCPAAVLNAAELLSVVAAMSVLRRAAHGSGKGPAAATPKPRLRGVAPARRSSARLTAATAGTPAPPPGAGPPPVPGSSSCSPNACGRMSSSCAAATSLYALPKIRRPALNTPDRAVPVQSPGLHKAQSLC